MDSIGTARNTSNEHGAIEEGRDVAISADAAFVGQSARSLMIQGGDTEILPPTQLGTFRVRRCVECDVVHEG